ncbi:MAG: hypothetical protein JXX14_17345 [Deltaproteobacteria bacterium]|nr:hypothetical protein [Deltaproteobacteria bacterium]
MTSGTIFPVTIGTVTNATVTIGAMILLLTLVSCKSEQPTPATDAGAVDNTVAAAGAAELGDGLDEEEAKALLREEKVLAGTSIGKDDVENELLRIEEEIRADIEGREPDFASAGVKPELKPLVARDTFTPDKAANDLEYKKEMAIMKIMREYMAEKKAEQANSNHPAD